MYSFRSLMLLFAFAFAAVSDVSVAEGASHVTTNYSEIANAVFIDLPGNNVPTTINVGAVTITPNLNWVNTSFGDYPVGDADNPGSGDGYATSGVGTYGVLALILDFSVPIAAFGATFQHGGALFPSPGLLTAYDGPSGGGNIIGSITTTGWLGSNQGNPDFVAVWSDNINIRSVVLTDIVSDRAFAIDGYGLSMTPVPETTSWMLILIATCVMAVIFMSRRRLNIPRRSTST